MEVPEPKKFRRSCFLSHLADLPLVKTAAADLQTFYSETKERSLLFRAWATMAELALILTMWGADKTVGKWCQAILRHEGEAQLAAAIDTYACVKLQQLEGKFPVLTKSADVVAKKTFQKVLSVACIIPRWMLETRLGKIAIFGLDKTLQLSVTVADLLQPEVEIEEGAPEIAVTMGKTTAPPAQEHDLTALVTVAVRTTASCARGLFPTLYGWFILTPLLVWVTVLTWTRQALRFMRRRPRRPSRRRSHRLAAKSDPDTRAKISSRRRMSPRKRIPSLTEALAQYIPKKAFSMLGLTTPPAEMTMPLFGTRLPGASNEELRVSPNMEEGEKRKRSAAENDEDENFLTMDLEKYRSDDDPDYPSESSSSTDSYEYISSQSEGDSAEEEVDEEPAAAAVEEEEAVVAEEAPAEEAQEEEEGGGGKDSGVSSAITTPTGSESPESNKKQPIDAPRPADSGTDVIKTSKICPADSSQPTATSSESVSEQ
ncbi:Hypp2609 [Branchiostoma lanceolatum]|uniref:Hypp2609 protein n=1 Tax=Branchiostoma lanceolatum TaxID=7740 RepID=A0A8J9ZT82_BRALA|nr:Hypp2609 [Branchiostoma lanceolatum]